MERREELAGLECPEPDDGIIGPGSVDEAVSIK